jgi:hypothetical protein
MPTSPYRPVNAVKGAAVPAVLTIELGNAKARGNGMRNYVITSFALAVSLVSFAFSEKLGAALLLLSLGWGVYNHWQRKHQTKFELRIEEGRLTVRTLARSTLLFALSDIDDVQLSSRTIQNLSMDQPLAAGGMSKVTLGPETGVGKIEFALQNGQVVPLTEREETYFYCTEVMGKVRAFLRKHGWVPLAERVED